MTEAALAPTPVKQDVIEEPVKIDFNYFSELANLDVKQFIEKKQQFSYLSWAHAIDQLKRKHPDAAINVRRFPEPPTGILVPYLATSLGYFVEVEVVVNGISVSEPFPVLNNSNKPIPKPTVFDINNSIQRAKVKAIAQHGLGLYVYAGEDVPSNDAQENKNQHQQYQQQYQQQQHQQYPQQQVPQPLPRMTQIQWESIRDLASEIARATSAPNATSDVLNSKFKDVYQTFQIHQEISPELADQKILELNAALKNIQDNAMVAQPAPQVQNNGLFNTGTQG